MDPGQIVKDVEKIRVLESHGDEIALLRGCNAEGCRLRGERARSEDIGKRRRNAGKTVFGVKLVRVVIPREDRVGCERGVLKG